MAGPRLARSDRFLEQPQQCGEGQRRGLPAAPLLHGRRHQAEDQNTGGHPAPGGPALQRPGGPAQKRLRGTQVRATCRPLVTYLPLLSCMVYLIFGIVFSSYLMEKPQFFNLPFAGH